MRFSLYARLLKRNLQKAFTERMCIHAVAADAVDTAMMEDAAAEMIADALTDADAVVTKQRKDAAVMKTATADATKEKTADATDS